MTPKQLKESTTKELLIAYKNKARCYHSEINANQILRELEIRIGIDEMQPITTATWHMLHGETDAEFNEQCDLLINKY